MMVNTAYFIQQWVRLQDCLSFIAIGRDKEAFHAIVQTLCFATLLKEKQIDT